MTPVSRAVGRPDRCSLAVVRQREQPRQCWRVLLLPAFYESPANSARLAGRGPLTSKPVRPQKVYFTTFCVSARLLRRLSARSARLAARLRSSARIEPLTRPSLVSTL